MAEINVPIDLVTPWGTIQFNRSSNTNYYWLTRLDGLDSATLRTGSTSFTARDGEAVHNSYSRGRIPVMSGQLVIKDAVEATALLNRRLMLENLAAALNSIRRADGTLVWTPSGASARQLTVRAWESMQVSGGFMKEFQFGLAAGNPTVVSTTLEQVDTSLLSVATGAGTWDFATAGGADDWDFATAGGADDWTLGTAVSPGIATVTNDGNADAWPILRVYGLTSGVVRVANLTTGQQIAFSSLEVPLGSYAEIDTWNETVYLNGQTNQSMLGGLDSTTSAFWSLAPGANSIQFYADVFDATTYLKILHRDSYTS